jgi:hypothetical protein
VKDHLKTTAKSPSSGVAECSGITGRIPPDCAGPFPNSIYADKLVFQTAVVPLPAGGLLILSALGGLAIARRRKKPDLVFDWARIQTSALQQDRRSRSQSAAFSFLTLKRTNIPLDLF